MAADIRDHFYRCDRNRFGELYLHQLAKDSFDPHRDWSCPGATLDNSAYPGQRVEGVPQYPIPDVLKLPVHKTIDISHLLKVLVIQIQIDIRKEGSRKNEFTFFSADASCLTAL